MANIFKRFGRLSTFRIIILGFLAAILLGAVLLSLPVSSAEGRATPFDQAIFTSTSAVCVTGLVVRDTASYWSGFGQAVILLLIQIGGLGVVTVAASITLLAGKKVSLKQKSTMQEAVAGQSVGSVVKLTGFIIGTTFAIEFIGALMLMPVFCERFGFRGVWMAFFHSVSAFCNAGFDIMGAEGAEFVSLTSFASNAYVNVVVMLLIISGGLGFLTWQDFFVHKLRVKRYRMQSKVILAVSGILILVPAIVFFIFDFAGLPLGERTLVSLFQSVTARTAGFNTVDFNRMNGGGRAIMIVLMLIGGSPGSTAGGLKTTTAAVLFANAIATFGRRESAGFFGRRIDNDTVRSASTLLMLYLTLFLAGAVIISAVESAPLGVCLFETASAVGTVGLTMGLTPSLGLASKIILMALMFLGRVGGLTLIYAALSGTRRAASKLPVDKITVG